MAAHFETFRDRAARESNSQLASDLSLVAAIAESIRDAGGRALVVGGFVRDEAISRLLGRPLRSKDIDVEVYRLDFPIVLELLSRFGSLELCGESFVVAKLTNPESGSILDFSLPREDSKTGPGHRDFRITGNPFMTIREAARRRDLTINALAWDPLTGEVFDEYGGFQDIRDGILRATDLAFFPDDALRVLRIMQFAGRFDFVVDPATTELCRSLDLTTLSRERIGEEWIKLMAKSERPSIGLEVARDLGILRQLHPELDILDTIEQEPDWHPEGNVWEHTKCAADAAAWVVRQEGLIGDNALVVLFGALCHDLGKATTTEHQLKKGVLRWTAHGHEAAGVEPTERFLYTLKMKHDVIHKILPIIREHLYHVHNPRPTDKQLSRFAQRLQPASIRLWNLVSRCDSNGRGEEFVPHTPSHALYERSLQLKVAEKPAPYIVQGRDLISYLGFNPGPHFKPVLDFLYDAQLGDAFTTVEAGIAYYREHEDAIQQLMQQHVAKHHQS